MRSLLTGSAFLFALCLLVATGCSKDDADSGNKKGPRSTLPRAEAAKNAGKGPRADGRNGADENRPRGGKKGGASPRAEENRPKAKAANGGGKPGPGPASGRPDPNGAAATSTANLFGDFAGLLTNDDGGALLCELTIGKGPSGALRGRVSIPALRIRDRVIAPTIQGDTVRFRPSGGKSEDHMTLRASGGGKAMLGSFVQSKEADAPRFAVELRRMSAEAPGAVSTEYRGTITMPSREVGMTLVVSVLPRGDRAAFVNALNLSKDPIALRQVKDADGGLQAVWAMGTAIGILNLHPTENLGLDGSLKIQGKEHPITLSPATEHDEVRKDDGPDATTPADAAGDDGDSNDG